MLQSLRLKGNFPFCLSFLRVLGLTLLCLLVGRGRLRAKSEATADCQWEPAWDSQQTNTTWKSYTTIRVDKRALAKSIRSLKRSLLRHILLPCCLVFLEGNEGGLLYLACIYQMHDKLNVHTNKNISSSIPIRILINDHKRIIFHYTGFILIIYIFIFTH